MTIKEKQELIQAITQIIYELPDDEEKADAKLNTSQSNKADRIELLTIKECTQFIEGLKECTVRQLVTKGKLPYIRSGAGERGKILVPKAALIKYFEI